MSVAHDIQVYDEMFDDAGRPRPMVDRLLLSLGTESLDQLKKYQRAADISLRNMGITFNVYGHADATERIWPFDVIPRVLAESDWLRIERGLQQRIRALNLFVADVHDRKAILRDGIVPSDLISSARPLRPQCVGLSPPHGIWCHITGTDLVRDSDGEFYVLEDNLCCPSGASYVIENREVMKRTMPHAFAGMEIRQVEDYPERLLKMLLSIAPVHVSDPTVVLLTPGMFNSAYFEHAFLAQQMGVKLVEGSDLVVDGGYVYVKTISGRKRVDVIYRRINDDFLDPASFRSDSSLGVAGLMDVYRAGNVVIANAPGTGVADDKAVYYYVPQMIKYYLSEDPILPNVETYLCSNERECQHVLANLEQFVVKPTNESGGYGIMMGPQSTAKEREECAARIRSNPRNYVAQPMLTLSTVPTISDEGVDGRHVDLRPFILHGPDEIYVLPGGLTRVALRKGSMVVNSSQGGGSKDTWILKSVPMPEAPIEDSKLQDGASTGLDLLNTSQSYVAQEEKDRSLLSRVAESVFWMSRYLERAESIARFLEVSHHLSLDAGGAVQEQWDQLVVTLGDGTSFEGIQLPTKDNTYRFLTFEQSNASSIHCCLEMARENARVARDVIPALMWEEINKLFLAVTEAKANQQRFAADPSSLLQDVKITSQTIVGIADAYMPHGQEWHFARIGRMLERADNTLRILKLKYCMLQKQRSVIGATIDVVPWSTLLKSLSAMTTYRRSHGRITPPLVVGYLVLDRQFPRSLHYCLIEALESLQAITGTRPHEFQNSAEKILGQLCTRLDYAKLKDILDTGLDDLMEDFQYQLATACDALGDLFFAKRPYELLE